MGPVQGPDAGRPPATTTGSRQDAQGYRDYFGAAAVNDAGVTWYSYDLGDVARDRPRLRTARRSAAVAPTPSRAAGWPPTSRRARAFCTMAIWHQPRFSSGDEHGNDPSVAPFWDALHADGADVVVNGHDHDYERFAPQDPEGRSDRQRGIREIVVGTGGAELRGFAKPVAEQRAPTLAGAVGVLKLTLHAPATTGQWIPAASAGHRLRQRAVPLSRSDRRIEPIRLDRRRMADHARAVIIGGGVGGTSIAYHLAERGWTDVVLVDRAELTSGSTFHSAGLVGQLRGSVTLTKMMMYGAELYRRLADETGVDPSWHEVGSLRLASSPGAVRGAPAPGRLGDRRSGCRSS